MYRYDMYGRIRLDSIRESSIRYDRELERIRVNVVYNVYENVIIKN
jgi:hypothetical protein